MSLTDDVMEIVSRNINNLDDVQIDSLQSDFERYFNNKPLYTQDFFDKFVEVFHDNDEKKIIPQVELPPEPEKIQHSENAWTPMRFKRGSNDIKVRFRRDISSRLNKLSDNNYDKLLSDIETIIKERLEEPKDDESSESKELDWKLEEFCIIFAEKSAWDKEFKHLYIKLAIKFKENWSVCFKKHLLGKFQGNIISPAPEKDEDKELYELKYQRWEKFRIASILFLMELCVAGIAPKKLLSIISEILISDLSKFANLNHICILYEELYKKNIKVSVNFEKEINTLKKYIDDPNIKPRERIVVKNMLDKIQGE